MKIYNQAGAELYDIVVNDSSVRYRSIMTDDSLTLQFSTTEPVTIPARSYADFEGSRYMLWRPSEFKKLSTREHEYTLVMHGWREYLKFVKYKDMSSKPYRLKFTLTAKPVQFLTNLINCLNQHDAAGGWTVGDCIDAPEKSLAFNHEYCLDVLGRMSQEWETEYEFESKKIHLRKVEKFKDAPLALSYGNGNGFLPGVGRYNESDKQPVGRLFVEGGERNIDYSKYFSKTLLLPKSQTLVYNGKTYRTDADGMYITRDGNSNTAEDSYDAGEIYPKRVGTVSEVIVVDAEKNFYDIKDASIPEALNYRDCRIAGEKAIIKFESGMLAGREFDIEQTEDDLTGYIHAERRFKIVPAELDGILMPGGAYVPQVNNTYAIFNINMPAAYISDNPTKTGASWDMMREAVRYFSENENDRFRFTGELDGIWAASRWLEIGGKIVPGGHVLFSDSQHQPVGVVIRIVGVKDYVNKPHKPEITLSNAPVSGSFSSGLSKLEADEVIIEDKRKEVIRYSRRQWRDAKETMDLLAASMLEFTPGISPMTVQTMQLLVGGENMQFRFVNSKTNPVRVDHIYTYNNTTKVFTAPAGILQHMSLGIKTVSPTHTASEYKFWDMGLYTSPAITDAGKAYYLYAKCAKSGTTGTFVLRETAIGMDTDASYYHFLYGILSSESDGQRSFAPLYGFTEILPGRITTDKLISQDGNTYFDLVNGIIGGNIKFKSGNNYVDVGLGISEAVNEIQTGGRNLWSSFASYGYWGLPNGIVTYTKDYSDGYKYTKAARIQIVTDGLFRWDLTHKIMEQGKYSVSFWYLYRSAGVNLLFAMNDNMLFEDNAVITLDGSEINIWKRYFGTIEVDNYIGQSGFIQLFSGNGSADILISDIMIVKGSIPSEWSPAPEDVQAEIEQTNEFITATTAELQRQIDGQVLSWFKEYDPTVSNPPASEWTTNALKQQHANDTFTNTLSGGCWRWQWNSQISAWEWGVISDTATQQALTAAGHAQDTADGKRRVFTSQPTVPYDVGDLWAQGISGDILRCQTAKAAGQSYASGDWVKAAKYTDDTAANEAWNYANEAYIYADQAQATANVAVGKLTDIASDNKLTPLEKQITKKEWDVIASEKTKIDNHADIYGVSKTAYGAAYTNLSNYVTPLLADLTTTSDITGTTFRSTFKAYYDARQDLLNAAATAAKTYSNNLIANMYVGGENLIVGSRRTLTAGANNYEYSILCGIESSSGMTVISNISSDNLLSPADKITVKDEWNKIAYEKSKIDSIADQRGVSKLAYDAAYTNLNNYLAPLLTNMSVSSSISSASITNYFQSYYNARQALLLAAGTYLRNGSTYVFTVGSIGRVDGTATAATVLLYDFVANASAEASDLPLSSTRQFKTITVPATGNWSLIIYSGIAGYTSGNVISFSELMLQEGNKASAFTPAVRHVTDALQGSTEIAGGLVATNLLMMKDINGSIRGGMSGLSDNIAEWFGGTYADAIADAAKAFKSAMTTGGMDKKDGSGHRARGKFAWDILGNIFVKGVMEIVGGSKIGLFDILDGAIIGRDAGGAERINISNKSIETSPTSLINQYEALYEYLDGNPVVGTFMNRPSDDPYTYQSGTLIEHSFSLAAAANIKFESGFSAVTFSNPSKVLSYSLNIYATVYLNGNLIGTAQPGVPFAVTGAGTVIIREIYELEADVQFGYETDFEISQAASGYGWYQAPTAKSAMGKNGLYSFWSANKYFYFSEEYGFAIRGDADIPAGLGGGSATSGGGGYNVWGKVTSASRASSVVTINHNIGDTKYTVQVAMNGSSTWYFQNKSANSIQVVCAGAFDFTLVRTPY